MDKKSSIRMKLGGWSFMNAFFSIQTRCGDKKFESQTPWSKNWCLVQELVLTHAQMIVARHKLYIWHQCKNLAKKYTCCAWA
jgi:hypothetical protein